MIGDVVSILDAGNNRVGLSDGVVSSEGSQPEVRSALEVKIQRHEDNLVKVGFPAAPSSSFPLLAPAERLRPSSWSSNKQISHNCPLRKFSDLTLSHMRYRDEE